MLSVHISKSAKIYCAVDKTAGSWEWKRFKRTEQQMRQVKKGPKDDKLDRRSLHNTLHSLRDTTVEVVTVKDSCLSNMVTTAVPD